jgi:hypothetical protein
MPPAVERTLQGMMGTAAAKWFFTASHRFDGDWLERWTPTWPRGRRSRSLGHEDGDEYIDRAVVFAVGFTAPTVSRIAHFPRV